MPCRFASSGTVATSRSASRAILALNVASNFLRDLVISVLHPLRQSRTLHTLTFGPISGVHFNATLCRAPSCLAFFQTGIRLKGNAAKAAVPADISGFGLSGIRFLFSRFGLHALKGVLRK